MYHPPSQFISSYFLGNSAVLSIPFGPSGLNPAGPRFEKCFRGVKPTNSTSVGGIKCP